MRAPEHICSRIAEVTVQAARDTPIGPLQAAYRTRLADPPVTRPGYSRPDEAARLSITLGWFAQPERRRGIRTLATLGDRLQPVVLVLAESARWHRLPMNCRVLTLKACACFGWVCARRGWVSWRPPARTGAAQRAIRKARRGQRLSKQTLIQHV